MRFRAQCADRHRRGVEAFEQRLRRFNLIDRDRFAFRRDGQQIAQHGDRPLVHQLGVGLIVAIFPAVHRFLQRVHHVRVVGVVFAAVHEFQQAALLQRFAFQPGALGKVLQILLEIAEAGAANAADHALEAQIRQIAVQADRFEQLGAAVRGDGRNAHLGHDLVQAFVDAVAVVQHHVAVFLVDRLAVHQLGQGFIGQVRVDGGRAEAEQHGEVVRIAGAGGFNDQVGVAAQAFFHQAGLHGADCHRSRHRQAAGRDGAVGQHQQHRAFAHLAFRFVAQGANGLLQILLLRIEGQIERLGAIVFAFQRGELFEIGVQQDRRFEAQAVRLAFGFAEHVHFAAYAGGQRHDVRFTQRIDRRIGDLRELLAEIVVNDARPAGEHGERGIVAHRTGGFLADLAQHADHLIQLFAAVAELFLVGFELRVVEFAAADLIVRQIFERHQTFDVFLHPLFIRVAAFQIVVGFRRVQDAAAAGVDHHQLAGADAAFFHHFIRLVIPDADFGGAGDQLVFGDHVARRAQAVAIEVTGGVAAVGHHDAGRAVPRLHVHRVEVEEGAQIAVHVRVVLPGRRHQQAHGADEIHPARQQQLQHVVQRTGVGAGFVDERRGGLEIRDQRRLEFIGTGACPLAVAGDGVDFAVVRQVAERLRQRPARHGVGGEALVEQANGRFQAQVRQIEIEAR